jgi:hypothetical protein
MYSLYNIVLEFQLKQQYISCITIEHTLLSYTVKKSKPTLSFYDEITFLKHRTGETEPRTVWTQRIETVHYLLLP